MGSAQGLFDGSICIIDCIDMSMQVIEDLSKDRLPPCRAIGCSFSIYSNLIHFCMYMNLGCIINTNIF